MHKLLAKEKASFILFCLNTHVQVLLNSELFYTTDVAMRAVTSVWFLGCSFLHSIILIKYQQDPV